MASGLRRSVQSWVTFPTVRRLARHGRYLRLWILAGVAYVLLSMLLGGMLTLIPGGSSLPVRAWVDWGSTGQAIWFIYPALVVTHPDFTLLLLFGPAVVMVVLGYLVGLSIASGAALLIENRRRRPDLIASGATPAVSGWALLGACCCVSCGAQTAAIGATAAVVGSTPGILVGQLWPLALVQLAIAWVSVAYMESVLVAGPRPATPAAQGWRLAVSALLRLGLIVAALTWILAFFVELAEYPGGSPGPGLLYHWAFEHWLLGGFAFAVALAPGAWRQLVLEASRRLRILRILLLVAGVTWGAGVPPPLTDLGLGGTLNEMLGYVGLPATWGSIPPDSPLGAALLFHWSLQHLLLAGWAIAFALFPLRALAVLYADRRAPAPGSPASQPSGVDPARPPALAVGEAPSE
ncbi:MAG TPA: hypothetical protein VJS68_02980 [Thermoplasmata archaeon]|nr:hypothetical protein [Thermoplasmata archaeon]